VPEWRSLPATIKHSVNEGASAMLLDYVPILVMFLVALFIAVFVIVLSGLLGPSRPSKRKLMPYESGMDPIGPAQRRFPIKFNLVAMIFILFDIEVIFFFPYALVYRRLGIAGLIEMGVFMLILLIGLFYIWKRGALEWD
jgi:NADH-quinone oxidoreductase subunit A